MVGMGIKELYVGGNPASETAQQAVQKALKDRYLDGAFLVSHLADVEMLMCGGLGWGDEEASRLAVALEHASEQGVLKDLTGLDLSNNKIGDEGMRHLADAFTRGAAPALKTLNLYANKIGDEGMRPLGDALARGGAPALEMIVLVGNSVSGAAQQEFANACKDRRVEVMWEG